jgi:hypothetical protein
VKPVFALMIHDETFSDEETFAIHSESFDKESKILVFEKTQKTRVVSYEPPLTQEIC